MRKTLSLVFFMLLFLLPLPLLADTIYSYTGNHFTSVTVPYTTSMSVSGSFTVAGGPLSCTAGCTVTPLSFNFYDGEQSITNLNATNELIAITTDGSGAIIYWDFQIWDSDGTIRTQYYISTFAVDEGLYYIGSQPYYGSNRGSHGIWSTSPASPAPEPATLILLGSGLAGLAGVRRRKFLG